MTFIGYYNCVNASGIYTPKPKPLRWQGLSPSQQLPVPLSNSQSLYFAKKYHTSLHLYIYIFYLCHIRKLKITIC